MHYICVIKLVCTFPNVTYVARKGTTCITLTAYTHLTVLGETKPIFKVGSTYIACGTRTLPILLKALCCNKLCFRYGVLLHTGFNNISWKGAGYNL